MGNTGEHDGAVLLYLGEALGHAVKADIDFPDFIGVYLFAQLAGTKITLLNPGRSKRQLLQRPVNQAGYQGSAHQRQRCRNHQPDDPSPAASQVEACRICNQPVVIPINVKADPQTGLVVDSTGH